MKKISHWMTFEIGEIATTFSGGTPNRSKPEYFLGSIPWIKSGELNAGWVSKTEECITEEALLNSSAKLVPPGTTLLALYGATAGVVGRTRISAAINQAILAIVPDESRLADDYLTYILRDLATRLLKMVQGAQPNLNAGIVRSAKVDLPPLSEQRKIAEILGTWDEALEKLDALIQAKERRKKALMQQLLTGKVRVRGFSEPWQTKRFRDLLLAQDRYVGFDDEHTYNLVSIRRRSGGVFFREALKGSDIKTKVMKRVHQGDFVISRMQVVHGALGMVRPECDGMYGSDSYDVFVAKDPSQLHMPFLDWISRLRSFWNLAYICSHGVHIEKMTFNLEDFMHEKIVIPGEISEQQEIAAILDTCDEELRLLREEREALDQQKRGLMQRLLTGKVRVTV
jgi:type I restriction enzyme S subunit